jgi:predicted PurR-regulated permease PerM
VSDTAVGSEAAQDPEGDDNVTIGQIVGQQQLPRWFWRAVIAVGFSVLVFIALRHTIEKLTSLLGMLGIALFLSFAIEPAVNFLADRGWRRGRATLVCFLLLFGVGGVFVGVMVSLVVNQVADLVEEVPGYIDEATVWVNDTFDTEITSTEINEAITDYQDDITSVAANMGGRVLSLTGSVLGIVFQAFTIALFSYYMISQGPQMRRNVCSLLPQRRQHVVLRLWELAIEKTGGWVYSRLLLATIAATTSWVVFMVLGLPSPLALALWLGLVSQFIPVVGTYLGGALPAFVALLNDPIDAIWVVAWILAYQQIENYLLSPRITGQTMNLHPAVAFGAAIAGAALFGPMGAVLALPAAAVIQAFVTTYLDRHEVVDSDLTKLDHIQATQGDSALRKALRRISRDESIDDLVPADAPGVDQATPQAPSARDDSSPSS